MTTASWCVLVALVMSCAGCAVARWRAATRGVRRDDRPCDVAVAFATRSPRMDAMQCDAFQSLSLFATAVLVAQQAGASQDWVDGVAQAWMGVRLAHLGCHRMGRPSLRRLAQGASLACVLGLFVGSALAGHPHAPPHAASRIERSAAGMRD